MDVRAVLSALFFAGGLLFFVLAAINVWGSGQPREEISLDEVTSTPSPAVDLQRMTAQPLVPDSAIDLQDTDVLSLIFLPANYDCGTCSRRAAAYTEAFTTHPAFEDLSTEAAVGIIESTPQTATHFARLQQFGVPAFQVASAPTSDRSNAAEPCFVLLVNVETEEAFFKIRLGRALVTEGDDRVFEAAREAYP